MSKHNVVNQEPRTIRSDAAGEMRGSRNRLKLFSLSRNLKGNHASRPLGKITCLVIAAAFAFCVAPTFISYKPLVFSWDDSDYLLRAIEVNRAFWSGNAHGLGAAMVSWHTPVMTLLGLPWRHWVSREAPGDCSVTLAVLIALLATLCLYLLLRVGVKPTFLVAASLCVGASLGPYQAGEHAAHTHQLATRFLADNLFAWVALLAALLIPYEMRIPCRSFRDAALRGVLCASTFSLGALTKVSFFYFIVLILPILLFIRFYHGEVRTTLVWLTSFICCSVPTSIYLLRYGRSAFAAGQAASFGGVAEFYRVPLGTFLANSILESPGLMLSLLLMAAALVYLGVTRRPVGSLLDFAPFLIMAGYGLVVLASANHEARFGFAVIVALPFLVSMLISDKEDSLPAGRAGLVASLAFLGLAAAALPTRQRSYLESLANANAVLAQAAHCDARSILLATDSPTLNIFLLNLASELSSSKIAARTLAYQAMSGAPIRDDFAAISSSDLVVFQDPLLLRPKFTNQRVPDYQKYTQELGSVPVRVAQGTSVYSTHCNVPANTASR